VAQGEADDERDFVVGGYTKGRARALRWARSGRLLGSGKLRDKLHLASHVGSGFDERTLAKVKARLEPLHASTCPFAESPELNAPTTWVEPKPSPK
jgi:bifunctional non-homologous end joining protein LigD